MCFSLLIFVGSGEEGDTRADGVPRCIIPIELQLVWNDASTIAIFSIWQKLKIACGAGSFKYYVTLKGCPWSPAVAVP